MTQILYNLSEEYNNIVKNLEDKLDVNINMLTIERIWYKLLAKYVIISVRYNQSEGK